MLVLDNAKIVDVQEGIYIGHLIIDHEKILDVMRGPYLGDQKKIDMHGLYLMSGMIDIHIHGSYGYDFIKDPKIAVKEVAEGLVKEGTTAFLSSLTVISHEDLCDLFDEYREIGTIKNGARFLGIHSEGPFLSKQYKALMNERYLRDHSAKEFKEMIERAGGLLKVMTVAPELEHFDDILDLAHKSDVRLMIGHSAASCKEAKEAIRKGVRGYTHLYNAMSQHTHRDPGIVTAALEGVGDYAELIVDGFHIDPDVIKVTYEVLGPNKIILITDAMLGKGMPDGEYVFSFLDCKKVGNTVRVIDTGRIAGSAITQLDAIRNMHDFTGASLVDLSKMSSYNPAKLLGIDDRVGSLAKGKSADIIAIDDDVTLHATFVDGKLVYQKEESIIS